MVLPAFPRQAEAYHYRYYSGHHHSYRSFGYYSPFRSHHYNPYFYGPYGRGRYPYPGYGRPSSLGSLDLALAKQAGLGAVQLQVRPRRAMVYLDGQLIGNVGDFDGKRVERSGMSKQAVMQMALASWLEDAEDLELIERRRSEGAFLSLDEAERALEL